MSSFISRLRRKRSDSQTSNNSSISAQKAKPNASRCNSADFAAYQVGGTGVSASTENQQPRRQGGPRAPSVGSAYRDDSADGRRCNPVNLEEETVQVSSAELFDLQKTVNINKDIIRSLMESQSAEGSNYNALKQSFMKLNQENQILLARLDRQKLEPNATQPKKTANLGIIVVDDEIDLMGHQAVQKQDSGEFGLALTQKHGEQISSLRKMCSELHLQIKKKDQCQSACAQQFLEMCQIAHYVCRNDIATKMRLQQLTRRYQRAMVDKTKKDPQAQQLVKSMSKYSGQDLAFKPANIRRNSTSDCSSESDEEEEEHGQRFIEIRAIDVNSEVMDLQGELKIAMLEIRRLRQQLTLLGPTSGQDETAMLNNTQVHLPNQMAFASQTTQGDEEEQENRTDLSKFEQERDSFTSFGGPNQKQQSRTDIKIGGRKDEIKLKGRGDNFKLQINEETKLNLSRVIAGQGAVSAIPTLDFRQLQQTQDYRDWYQYSLKLEESIKYLRQRIKSLEDDQEDLTVKFRGEMQAKDEALGVNKKLVDALQTMRYRVQQVKDKYRVRAQKISCANCDVNQASRHGRNSALGGGVSDLDSIDYDDILNQAGSITSSKQPKASVASEYGDAPQILLRNRSAQGLQQPSPSPVNDQSQQQWRQRRPILTQGYEGVKKSTGLSQSLNLNQFQQRRP